MLTKCFTAGLKFLQLITICYHLLEESNFRLTIRTTLVWVQWSHTEIETVACYPSQQHKYILMLRFVMRTQREKRYQSPSPILKFSFYRLDSSPRNVCNTNWMFSIFRRMYYILGEKYIEHSFHSEKKEMSLWIHPVSRAIQLKWEAILQLFNIGNCVCLQIAPSIISYFISNQLM